MPGDGVGQEDRAGGERAAERLGDRHPLQPEALRTEIDEVRLAVELGVGDARLVLVHEPRVPQPALVLVGLLHAARLRVGEDPAGDREVGSPRRLLGLEVLDLAVRRHEEDAAEDRPADEQALVLEVRHEDARSIVRLDPDRFFERDEEAPLEQLPAQAVGDLQPRRGL